jgi:hypothetical protein
MRLTRRVSFNAAMTNGSFLCALCFAGRRGKVPSVAEAELAVREQHINSQLTRANENLQRATVAALEADRASVQVRYVGHASRLHIYIYIYIPGDLLTYRNL